MSTAVDAANSVLLPQMLPGRRSEGACDLVAYSALSSDVLQEIEAFVDSQRCGHPFQLLEWSSESGLYLISRERSSIRLFARCDLIHPLGRGFPQVRALSLTRGPVCDDPAWMGAALLQLVDWCRNRGFLYLDINPDWTGQTAEQAEAWLEIQGWFAVGPARTSLRIDLKPELEIILAGFRKSTRSEIRRAQRIGVEVSASCDFGAIDNFLELYRNMAGEKNFPPDPEDHIRQVLTRLQNNPSRGVLLSAALGSDNLGGAVVVRAGSRCWYIWGATKKNANAPAGHILQWHAVQWAKQQGCNEYDLGGYREGAGDGPALFKKGFSGAVAHFLPTYRYPINSLGYSAFRFLRPGLYAARTALNRLNRR